MSPILFAILTGCWTKNIKRRASRKIMFVDDVLLCYNTREEPHKRLEIWRKALEERRIKIT